MRLSDGITLELVNDGRGWRFRAWGQQVDGEKRLPPPSPEDQSRLFPSRQAAMAHFRKLRRL